MGETGARPKQYVPAPKQNIWRASVLDSDDEEMPGSDVEGDAAATEEVRQDVQKSGRSGSSSQAEDSLDARQPDGPPQDFNTLFDEMVLGSFAELSLETTAEKSDQGAVGANNTQEIALSDLCLEGEWGHLLEPQGRPIKKAIRQTNKSS